MVLVNLFAYHWPPWDGQLSCFFVQPLRIGKVSPRAFSCLYPPEIWNGYLFVIFMKSMYDIMKHEKVEGQYSALIDWWRDLEKSFYRPWVLPRTSSRERRPIFRKNKWFLSPSINTDNATHCLGHDSKLDSSI